ncbi:Uncharacterised protein [uncultured archaeon]|nr:Uncharacterised protein [uncultured archaeon]
MILTADQAAMAETLASTPDDILPLFPVMERAVIMVAKEIMRKESSIPK